MRSFAFTLAALALSSGALAQRLPATVVQTHYALWFAPDLQNATFRGRETIDARIGLTYAIAASLTILFLASDPHGDAQMVNLLKGDILATTAASLQARYAAWSASNTRQAVVRRPASQDESQNGA